MYTDGQIYMGLADGQRVNMQLNMSNRHGLIAGASGTGKTITMKAMAESFSDAGVPVFLCDVKGDVSGIATAGVASEPMDKRIDKFGICDSFSYKAYPVCFWDIYQEGGHPVRATISDMGPELLSRILGLTAAQKKKEKAAERRQAQIERQLINTGAQVIKRGILSMLFGK